MWDKVIYLTHFVENRIYSTCKSVLGKQVLAGVDHFWKQPILLLNKSYGKSKVSFLVCMLALYRSHRLTYGADIFTTIPVNIH